MEQYGCSSGRVVRPSFRPRTDRRRDQQRCPSVQFLEVQDIGRLWKGAVPTLPHQ